MSARKKTGLFIFITICFFVYKPLFAMMMQGPTLASAKLAKELGWTVDPGYKCGGYYLEEPFIDLEHPEQNSNLVHVTSNQGLVSQRGTSNLEGGVTITRHGQQITTDKAFLYRDPNTGELSAIDMIGDVHLREPNTLIVAKEGRYNFETKTKSLRKIFYRTAIYGKQIIGSKQVSEAEREVERKVKAPSAWGKAYEFSQTQPLTYELRNASYSTCPPLNPAWKVRASHIFLDKNTGRGYATNARLLIRNVPVLYAPYINFPIDSRRKTGFLWPTFGVGNSNGPSVYVPFYWNIAPNLDLTITPGMLRKRGIQLAEDFRYLSTTSEGSVYLSLLPGDKAFAKFQTRNKNDWQYKYSPSPIIRAELQRLANSSTTRKAFVWRDKSRFNDHWSSKVDFNYVGDDYYMDNLGNNLNEYSTNQLLQQGDLYYKSTNWNFTGRLQAYQTLHPIDADPVQNVYRRVPQLVLNGDYPNQLFGLEYFINSEATNFDIRNTPGTFVNRPTGIRLHAQPGVSLPIYLPYFFINPRMQLALTDYNLKQTAQTSTPNNKQRALPIFDIASGFAFNRDMSLFNRAFQQTLEPQVYYTYIPYRNQSSIPLFDTADNTLYYDQLFNYNRFTGIDRIGDANQISLGVTTRLIDRESGLQKVLFGVGNIIYFADRRVTLCNNTEQFNCTNVPNNPANSWRLSPITSTLSYAINPTWSLANNTIWSPISKQLNSSIIVLHYQTDVQHIINLSYSYSRTDIYSGVQTQNSSNNLKVTDFSFAWPVINDFSAVGNWSHDWNPRHLKNILVGLQYDTCCWGVRLVGGRAYFSHDTMPGIKKWEYRNEFYFQFSLKGLGNVGRDPGGVLAKSISGYTSQFGQEV